MGLQHNSNIVITGGAGFVGSALARRLLAMGCSVTIIDDLSGGTAANLPDDPRLTLHKLCIGCKTADQIDHFIANADLVYHLASPIGVAQAHRARYEVVESILDSGLTVIRACRTHRRPLLLTSSSEIYGQGLPRPILESDPVNLDISPRWGYASAKMALEQMTAGLWLEHGIPAWPVRPFNIAGARQRPQTGLVVASFVAAAAAGQPLEIHGDGLQLRSFLHVEDAVEALIAIPFNDSLMGRPVNIGSASPISIGALAKLVLDTLGADSPLVYRPYQDMLEGRFSHAPVRIPDIRLITEATGWRPTRSLEDAIRDCHHSLPMDAVPALAGA